MARSNGKNRAGDLNEGSGSAKMSCQMTDPQTQWQHKDFEPYCEQIEEIVY